MERGAHSTLQSCGGGKRPSGGSNRSALSSHALALPSNSLPSAAQLTLDSLASVLQLSTNYQLELQHSRNSACNSLTTHSAPLCQLEFNSVASVLQLTTNSVSVRPQLSFLTASSRYPLQLNVRLELQVNSEFNSMMVLPALSPCPLALPSVAAIGGQCCALSLHGSSPEWSNHHLSSSSFLPSHCSISLSPPLSPSLPLSLCHVDYGTLTACGTLARAPSTPLFSACESPARAVVHRQQGWR